MPVERNPSRHSWRRNFTIAASLTLLSGCLSQDQQEGLNAAWDTVTDTTISLIDEAGTTWNETDFQEMVDQARAALSDLYDQSGGLFSDLFGDPADSKETYERVVDKCPEMIGPITEASERTEISANYLLALAYIESSCNPKAKASTTTAAGMFQFVEQTWLMSMHQHGGKYGRFDEAKLILVNKKGRAYVTDESKKQEILDLRHDASLSALLAAELAKDNFNYMNKRVDRDIDATALYMAHFLGPYGATQFLVALDNQPSSSAAALFPPAAKANPWVFRKGGPSGQERTVREVHVYFQEKIQQA